MRPLLIVVHAPILHLLVGVGKRQESVGVQALCPEATVERLDEGVVRRLAGAGEVQFDALRVSPQVQIRTDKLCPLVDPDRPRITVVATIRTVLANAQDARDEATASTFATRLEAHEKAAWMLTSLAA